MTVARFVIFGLAPARTAWFSDVGAWSAAGAIPADFIRCVSTDEMSQRVAAGQVASAVLLDGQAVGANPGIVASLTASVGPCIVVGDAKNADLWRSHGAADVLAPTFSRGDLLLSLRRVVTSTDSEDVQPLTPVAPEETAPPAGLAPCVVVTGSGGSGASTLAIALAQGMAGVRTTRRSIDRPVRAVLLADLCLRADQAMLHDLDTPTPALLELVEQSRHAQPPPSAVRESTFAVPARGYRLLAGLRNPTHWTTFGDVAIDAVVTAMCRSADAVVIDTDPDVEGARETGSVDVEERHALARAAMAHADVVLVTGTASMQGVHAFVRAVDELLRFGVPAARIQGVVRGAPRGTPARHAVLRAIRELVAGVAGDRADGLARPGLVPRWSPETALRDGRPLPRPVPAWLARLVDDAVARAGRRDDEERGPRASVARRIGGRDVVADR